MTSAITQLATAVEKKENQQQVSFFSPASGPTTPRPPRAPKEKSKLELVTDWMRDNQNWLDAKGQDALDAYQAATKETTSLPYIRQAQKAVKNETGTP